MFHLLSLGGSAGQPLKILSPQGQGISLANLSLAKPISLRPAGKNIPGNVSVLQPKQVIMKKVIQTQKNIGNECKEDIVIKIFKKPFYRRYEKFSFGRKN